MPLPAGLSTVTVTGTYQHPDGTPVKGKLLFTPEPAILASATHGVLLLGTIESVLDEDGVATVTLLATDDPDLTPTGWTYRVQERWYDAPGRSYPLSLPSAAPVVDLADVAPTAPADGEYVVVTGPAGPTGPQGPAGPQGEPGDPASNLVTSVNGEQGIVVLNAADVGADPAGSAAAAQAAASTDAANKVTAHEADTTGVHGIASTADLVVTTDARLTNSRTPTAHAATHAAAGSDPVTLTQAQITGLTAALTALLPLTGGTLTGGLTIDGANLTVTRADDTGAYRFRVTGGGLDLEIGGLDVTVSSWTGADFTGTQRNVMRWEGAGPHLIGRTQFGTTPFDNVHDIDAGTGVAALGKKNGLGNIRLAGYKATVGAPTTGTWTTGDVVLDSAGAWHLCTTGGTPGTWT
jgi:hypothetical protein